MFSKCQWASFLFDMEGFSDTALLHKHFHVRLLLFCCTATKWNGMECWWEGSTCTAIQSAFASEIMGQHSKTGSITFRAVLVQQNNPSAFYRHHILKQVNYAWRYPTNFEMKQSQNFIRIIHAWGVVHATVMIYKLFHKIFNFELAEPFYQGFFCASSVHDHFCVELSWISASVQEF